MSNVIRLQTTTERDRKAAFQAELGVSTRAVNLLWARGVRSIDGLAAMSLADVRVIRGVGWLVLQEIDDALARLGIRLKPMRKHVESSEATDAERTEAVASLHLSPATVKLLTASGIGTVGGLLGLTSAQLGRLPRLGTTMREGIRYALRSRGSDVAPSCRSAA